MKILLVKHYISLLVKYVHNTHYLLKPIPYYYHVVLSTQGRIQDFKLGRGGAHLKKLRLAEGGAKIFGVVRVKNHDFTPKNHIFSNFRGGAGCAPPPPPGSAPGIGE